MIIQPDLLTHWKFQALCRALGRAEAFTTMLALWGHCQNSKTWIFDFSLPMLAGVCQYQGDPAILRQTLLECRVLDELPDGSLEVHGWAEKNTTLVAAWENGRKSGRQHAKPSDTPRDTPAGTRGLSQTAKPETRGITQAHDSETHGLPVGGTIDREIDREIDRIEGENPAPAGPAASMIFWTPASGWTGFTPVLRENLTKAFPGIDLDLACMETDRWLRDNPAKAKKKNWFSFLTNWLRRSSPSGDSRTDDGTSQNHAQKNEGGAGPPAQLVRPEPDGPWRGAFEATYGRPAETGWADLPPAIQREIKDLLRGGDPLLLASWAALEKNEGRAAA